MNWRFVFLSPQNFSDYLPCALHIIPLFEVVTDNVYVLTYRSFSKWCYFGDRLEINY